MGKSQAKRSGEMRKEIPLKGGLKRVFCQVLPFESRMQNSPPKTSHEGGLLHEFVKAACDYDG